MSGTLTWGGVGGELASLGAVACWRVLETGWEAAAATGLEAPPPALGVGLVGATGTGARGAV